jgi:hypothetical protein
MRILVILIAFVLLVITAPVWVPVLGAVALLGAVGVGASMVAADHAKATAPPPAMESSVCPCTSARWLGIGDASDPQNWSWTWHSDGMGHMMSKRPTGFTDEAAQAWIETNGYKTPANQAFVANVARDWGVRGF